MGATHIGDMSATHIEHVYKSWLIPTAVQQTRGQAMCAAQFPDGFLWGSATAAYQVEGSPLADGAGPSIWHRFTRTPWLVHSGDNGDVTCDHYHRYEEDVRLMRELGLNAYRFSVSWSRILPEGTGRVNEKGLDF